jgi:putative transcriptional regulator
MDHEWIEYVLEPRGRVSLTELSLEVDITLANLSVLKRGKARAIRFSTLVAICEALKCQPGDLLELEDVSGDEIVSIE